MSDEYASSGYKGSLVNDSIADPTKSPEERHKGQIGIPGRSQTCNDDSDYATHNYPTNGDTTSSGGGGYGSPTNVWSDRAQRGNATNAGSYQDKDAGLVDQSTSGGPLKEQLQDARQGRDEDTRRDYGAQRRGDAQAGGNGGGDQLNPTFSQNEDNGEF